MRGAGRRSGNPGQRDVGGPAPRRRSDSAKPVAAAPQFGAFVDCERGARCVLPRTNASAAALSYDGRETAADLRSLVTSCRDRPRLDRRSLPPPGSGNGLSYIEMVQPNDVARQIRLEPSEPQLPLLDSLAFRYALFGHDFEKGVVFRARLRGYWTGPKDGFQDVSSIYQQFLNEPPPLGP